VSRTPGGGDSWDRGGTFYRRLDISAQRSFALILSLNRVNASSHCSEKKKKMEEDESGEEGRKNVSESLEENGE
jgi:hypothetical protein